MTKAMAHFIETLKKAEPTIVDTIHYITFLSLMGNPNENRDQILYLLQEMCQLCGLSYKDLLNESAKVGWDE